MMSRLCGQSLSKIDYFLPILFIAITFLLHLGSCVVQSNDKVGSKGCLSPSPSSAAANVDTPLNGSIIVDGHERSFIYYLPPTYDHKNPFPLVLSLHG